MPVLGLAGQRAPKKKQKKKKRECNCLLMQRTENGSCQVDAARKALERPLLLRWCNVACRRSTPESSVQSPPPRSLCLRDDPPHHDTTLPLCPPPPSLPHQFDPVSPLCHLPLPPPSSPTTTLAVDWDRRGGGERGGGTPFQPPHDRPVPVQTTVTDVGAPVFLYKCILIVTLWMM